MRSEATATHCPYCALQCGIEISGGPAGYAGISYERLAAERGVFWPCPSEDHPGTPRLSRERFPTPSGRARFHPTPPLPPAEDPDGEFPLYLTTGRLLGHYQWGTQTRRVPRLAQMAPRAVARLHPSTARRCSLVAGGEVVLETRRGKGRFQRWTRSAGCPSSMSVRSASSDRPTAKDRKRR